MKAWKLPDGRYQLVGWRPDGHLFHGWITGLGGERAPGGSDWVVPESALARIKGVEKVFGVVAGPLSCGCEPAMFRYVTGREVEAGRTESRMCPECSARARPPAPAYSHCDIIDVCGEPDVARRVYEAEFRDRIEALS